MGKQGLEFKERQPKIQWKTFKDSNEALEMSNIQKLRPRT